jgi:murein DD-endopeptidase MepM/ murein hydrolase activator NlpD
MRSGVCVLVVALAVVAAPVASAAGPATTAATTTTAESASYQTLAPARLPSRCASAGAAAIVEPGSEPLVVGAAPASLGASAYPGSDAAVAFGGAAAAGRACKPGSVSIRSLSLFGGEVTADAVSAESGRGSVSGLQVEGTPVTLGAGESTAVQGWGLLIADDSVGRTLTAALALHLLEPRGSLPAGTVILVGYHAAAPPAAPAKRKQTAAEAVTATTSAPVRTPAPIAAKASAQTPATHRRAHRHKHRRKGHPPLKVTPALGVPRYDFPVARGADYGDSYGGPRSDIQDGWHHGDDLFAPLGTPVVAVADGTLSLVGWNELGGWRVWLEDARGNEFYYAHLAAYSRWILHHRHVRAGQVIGFLGRTGDAFTTPPHLHFEIHPRGLFKLGYDGAVDPTTYLQSWRIVRPAGTEIPRPARLRAPKGTPQVEASVVWRQLMVARGLLPAVPEREFAAIHPGPAGDGSSHFAPPRRLAGVVRASAAADPASGLGVWVVATLCLAALAGGVGALLIRRLGRRDETPSTREA